MAALKNNLPGIVIDWLRGETEAEIEADAQKLLRFMGLDTKPKDINQMAPDEIRANAKELMRQETDKIQETTKKIYADARKPEEIRKDYKGRSNG